MGRSLHAKIPSTGGALGSTALGIGQFEGSRDNQSHQWKSWRKSDLWCQSWSRVCRKPPCFSPHMEDLRDAILAWAQAGAGSLGIYFSPSQCVCLEVSRLASQEAGHHKSRPDYRLWTYDSYDSCDMTYLNIQDFSGKCNQRHVNVDLFGRFHEAHLRKALEEVLSFDFAYQIIISGIFLSMILSRLRWVLKSNSIWKALSVSAGDRGRSTHHLNILLFIRGNWNGQELDISWSRKPTQLWTQFRFCFVA